jgi:hypothetical protein
MKPLLQRIERGEIDPTRIITHTLPLDEAEHGFEIFKNKQDNCEKVVLKPMAPGLTRGNGRCNSTVAAAGGQGSAKVHSAMNGSVSSCATGASASPRPRPSASRRPAALDALSRFSYASRTEAAIRPRADTSKPLAPAHARMAAVSSRVAEERAAAVRRVRVTADQADRPDR